jgi:hypothetical protein
MEDRNAAAHAAGRPRCHAVPELTLPKSVHQYGHLKKFGMIQALGAIVNEVLIKIAACFFVARWWQAVAAIEPVLLF